MLKKLGLAGILGIGMLALAHPQKADARVRFGVSIGVPAYTYPVTPYYGYTAPYPDYAYPPVYGYAPEYVAPAPAYVSPYVYGYGYNRWGHERHEFLEHHEGREFHGGHGEHHGRR